jgi:hypothetical protein
MTLNECAKLWMDAELEKVCETCKLNGFDKSLLSRTLMKKTLECFHRNYRPKIPHHIICTVPEYIFSTWNNIGWITVQNLMCGVHPRTCKTIRFPSLLSIVYGRIIEKFQLPYEISIIISFFLGECLLPTL